MTGQGFSSLWRWVISTYIIPASKSHQHRRRASESLGRLRVDAMQSRYADARYDLHSEHVSGGLYMG